MTEADFLAALRTLPLHPGALDLRDDAARLGELVLTTDLIVESVHFLPDDSPGDVAWKLVAANLSDLAAKGAVPEGVLLGYPLRDDKWDAAFLDGLRDVLTTFGCALLGGDTVSGGRSYALTAIGRATVSPTRSGAQAGDTLWVTGTIGDAGAGLAIARGADGPAALLARYRRPTPRLAEGQALAPHVTAMMDVSDGLLIDAERLAAASGCAVTIALDALPLSPKYRAWGGDALASATAGDDYELLFTLPSGMEPPVAATRIGSMSEGAGLTLTRDGAPVPLPPTLGWQHR
ncbi:thiamine-phosphate kinase [Sphingomonas donggukensis]|uniref:Thiamine-monophosphate kinase n=1 Tax=Sphingomonas donggukensis TaxID=2949093 RepID=A0ABY4TQ28_9SPHN|nr:thiamine-phosphate kinase [Sphingomonas donggukensis]URW74498.1 thiamine-phosphate kinase [Sphingomonas donggukensis]